MGISKFARRHVVREWATTGLAFCIKVWCIGSHPSYLSPSIRRKHEAIQAITDYTVWIVCKPGSICRAHPDWVARPSHDQMVDQMACPWLSRTLFEPSLEMYVPTPLHVKIILARNLSLPCLSQSASDALIMRKHTTRLLPSIFFAKVYGRVALTVLLVVVLLFIGREVVEIKD